MTGTELGAAVRRRLGSVSTNVLSAADLLVIANEAKNDLALQIAERNSQYFTVPVLFNLVASSVSAREYPWPDDILSRLVTVECDFETGNSPLKYLPLKPYPGGMERLTDDIGGITEANIIANFSNDDSNECGSVLGCGAFYVQTRRGIYILSGSIVAVTNGGKIRYRAYPADLENLSGSTGLHLDPTTTTFGMPLQFHNLWADLCAIKYKTERPNPIPLSEREKEYPIRLEEALRSIGKDDQREEVFGSLPAYNNGLDL